MEKKSLNANNDSNSTFSFVKERVKFFCDERDWGQFHNAKDLSIGIVTEASELLDLFRFKSLKEVEEMFQNKEKKELISSELADVLFFVLRLSEKYKIDLSYSLNKKLLINSKKYPVEKARGSNKKYSEL